MKKDPVFTEWCQYAVPVIIDACVAHCELEGGSFALGVRSQLSIAGADGMVFPLLLPDAICLPDGSGPVSRAAFEAWLQLVSDEIASVWTNSYNGKKHKLLSDLNSFAILHPNLAKDLVTSLKFKDGQFFFDVGNNASWRLSKHKFEGWLEKRESGKTID